jgi:hypothetical protein
MSLIFSKAGSFINNSSPHLRLLFCVKGSTIFFEEVTETAGKEVIVGRRCANYREQRGDGLRPDVIVTTGRRLS